MDLHNSSFINDAVFTRRRHANLV